MGKLSKQIKIVKFYNDGVVQAVTFASSSIDEFLVFHTKRYDIIPTLTVALNVEFRPISGFGINDWWSVINNFDRRLIYSTKPRVSTSVYRAGRHASVNLVYNSKSRCYAEENRTEFNCMRWYHRLLKTFLCF